MLIAILIAFNFILSPLNARVDLTEGNVYTLSPATKGILSKLEAPVKIRFYYSQTSAVPVGLKTFAKRVEDLLAEKHSEWPRGGGLQKETGRELWESRELHEWQALAKEFGFTQIVTYPNWKLKLPIVAHSKDLLLYDVPQASAKDESRSYSPGSQKPHQSHELTRIGEDPLANELSPE